MEKTKKKKKNTSSKGSMYLKQIHQTQIITRSQTHLTASSTGNSNQRKRKSEENQQGIKMQKTTVHRVTTDAIQIKLPRRKIFV